MKNENKLWLDSDDNDLDEPSKDDTFGFMEAGFLYGASRNETNRFICEYNIQDQCELYEETSREFEFFCILSISVLELTRYTFNGDPAVAKVTVSDHYPDDAEDGLKVESAVENMFDGDKDTIWHSKKDSNGRVTVKFEDTFQLQKIDIFRRRECCEDRYKGMEVLIKWKGKVNSPTRR